MDTKTAWLFDIDGVITNPETKHVEEKEITDFIVQRLENGDFVALVTGRALSWILDRVTPLIESGIKNPVFLNNFYVSGEFGGTFMVWDNGTEKSEIDRSISIPQEIISEAKKAAEEFSDSNFFDPDKKTMVSIEMKDGMRVEDFAPIQARLADALRSILDKYDQGEKLEVHVDRIATNIRDKNLNKHYSARQVAKWIDSKGIKPEIYRIFGDSASDVEMAEEINSTKTPIEMIFVGEKDQLKGKNFNFPVIFTDAACDKGVLEFIHSFKVN